MIIISRCLSQACTREKYAACQVEKHALEEMINISARVRDRVSQDFSGWRKRMGVASGQRRGFIVTNGRGTKIYLIKTWHGQHTAPLCSAYGREGLICLPLLSASLVTTEFNPYPRRATWDQCVVISMKKRRRERERNYQIGFVRLFISFVSLEISLFMYLSSSLSLYLSLFLCHSFRKRKMDLFISLIQNF